MDPHPFISKYLSPQLKMIVFIFILGLTCIGGQQIPPVVENTWILRNVTATLDKLSLQLNDVNECLDDEAFQCEENEDCLNTLGSYECQCQEGYYREGNTCQEACLSPSLYLEDLGCISVISDQGRSWDDMKTKCQVEGKRLLEGIKYKHLQPLANHFTSVLGYYYSVWIGMKDSRWITSGEEVTDEDLWWSRQPNDGNDDGCVLIYTNPSSPGLRDYTCSSTLYALCQSLPPY